MDSRAGADRLAEKSSRTDGAAPRDVDGRRTCSTLGGLEISLRMWESAADRRVSVGQGRAFGTCVGARPDSGPEEVEEDAQYGEGRDGEDHASQPCELAAADHRQ
jgi:hypothetical protein